MSGASQILIYGRVGKEPELKYTRKLEPVCHLTVAENIQDQEKPNWHKVIVWGKQAETCQVMLKKGGSVFVRGRIVEREFKNDQGETKKYKEVNADLVGFTLLQ